MTQPPPQPRRSSRFAAFVAYAAVAGSALGVIYWSVASSRRAASLDTSGFDIAAAPSSVSRPVAPAAPSAPAPNDGMRMVKAGGLAEEVDTGRRRPAPPPAAPPAATAPEAPAAPEAAVPEDSAAEKKFTEEARKHEKDVLQFTRNLERRYPSLTQYAKDWNAAPDLRALKDQYWRDHDPVKFAYGLAKSPTFPGLVKKYATDPGIQAYVVEGVKSAPGELVTASVALLGKVDVIRDLVEDVTKELKLPPDTMSALAKAQTANATQAAQDLQKIAPEAAPPVLPPDGQR